MALGKSFYIEKYKNYTNEELKKSLNELTEFLNSEQLKKMREEEINQGIDDNNCVTNVEIEINTIKEIIDSKKLKQIIEETIGNNDPYWNEPIYKIAKEIINLPDGTETTIVKLLNSNNFTSKQLFDIYLVTSKVCNKLNIKLDSSKNNTKVDGLLYNVPFIIKHLNKENNSKKLLLREELAEKFYGYHSKNNINSKNETLGYLNMITNYLNTYEFKNNNNFIMCGRKKFLYEEIINVLNGSQNEKNPLYFVLGSLEEFMSNNNFIYSSETNFAEVKDKNDDYIKNGCICLEEKNYIDNIIKAIKNYIFNNDDLKEKDDCIHLAKSINDKPKQSLEDLIRNISPDPFWQITIKKYFDALNINTAEKEDFLVNVSANKSLFNEFTKEIKNFTDSNSIYEKYYELVNSKNDNVNNNEDFYNNYNYYKNNETDVIWWVEKTGNIGEHLFTFDKKKIYNLFKDYPYELSKNEKEIFDKENPYWADFFKDRNNNI